MFGHIGDIDTGNCRQFGRVYGTYEGSVPVLMIHDTDIIREIYNTRFADFANQFGDEADSADSFQAKNIMFANGEVWRNLRQTVTRTQTKAGIVEMTSRVETESLLQEIQSQAGRSVKVSALVKPYALTLAARAMFGIDFDLFRNPMRDHILESSQKLIIVLSPFSYLPYSAFWFAERLPRFLLRFCGLIPDTDKATLFYQTLMRKVYQERGQNSLKSADLLQSFQQSVQNGTVSDEQRMVNSILLIAGVWGSIAETICLVLYALAKHPDKQQLVMQEVDQKTAGQKEISYEIMTSLTYLDAFIMETLRLYPLEARGHRTASVAGGTTVPGTGITLPKGSVINIPLISLHTDPDLWDRPHDFDPTRFLPENKDQVKACAFMSFASGPRMCPGVNFAKHLIKHSLLPILKQFQVVDPEPASNPFPKNARKASAAALRVTFIPRGEK